MGSKSARLTAFHTHVHKPASWMATKAHNGEYGSEVSRPLSPARTNDDFRYRYHQPGSEYDPHQDRNLDGDLVTFFRKFSLEFHIEPFADTRRGESLGAANYVIPGQSTALLIFSARCCDS